MTVLTRCKRGPPPDGICPNPCLGRKKTGFKRCPNAVSRTGQRPRCGLVTTLDVYGVVA